MSICYNMHLLLYFGPVAYITIKLIHYTGISSINFDRTFCTEVCKTQFPNIHTTINMFRPIKKYRNSDA